MEANKLCRSWFDHGFDVLHYRYTHGLDKAIDTCKDGMVYNYKDTNILYVIDDETDTLVSIYDAADE
jgi:hypothetical protein